MKKLILIMFIVLSWLCAPEPCDGALTFSADNYNDTFGNGYAWGGHNPKDHALTWAQQIESGVIVGTAAGRGPSPLIWSSCNWGEISDNPELGFTYWDDYLGTIDVTTGDGYTITALNSGAISGLATEDGGVFFADSAGNNAADDGLNIQLANCAFKAVAGRTIWCEFRVKMNDTSALISQFYIGLAAPDTTLIAAGVLDDTVDKAGFFRQGDTTADRLESVTARTSAEDITADVATVADGTYVKLGFIIDGLTSIKFYVDGVLVETGVTTANLPNAVMALSYVSQTEGASKDSELSVDWVRIAQLN